MISDEELARVKALAEAATPGPWECVHGIERGDYGSVICRYCEGVKGSSGDWVVRFDDDYGTGQAQANDAAYIAAANPEFVLRLIARIEELERSLVRGPRGVLDL